MKRIVLCALCAFGLLCASARRVQASPLPADSLLRTHSEVYAADRFAIADFPQTSTSVSDECCREAREADSSPSSVLIAVSPEPPAFWLTLAGLLACGALFHVRGSQRRIPRS